MSKTTSKSRVGLLAALLIAANAVYLHHTWGWTAEGPPLDTRDGGFPHTRGGGPH
jgi:hypothetical protein